MRSSAQTAAQNLAPSVYSDPQDVLDALHVPGSRGHDLILFLSYSGLRIGEAAGLRALDVDLTQRRITVERAVTEAGAANPIKAPKIQARRTVPFPEFLDKILAARIRGKSLDDPVFPADGHPTTREFPTVTTHDLRHTAASLAISADAIVKAVQRMMGHAKASMTLDTYADLFPDDLERVATKLSEQRAAELKCVQNVSQETEEALPERLG